MKPLKTLEVPAIWSGIVQPPGQDAIAFQLGAIYLEEFLRKVAERHDVRHLTYVSFYDGANEVVRAFTTEEIEESILAMKSGEGAIEGVGE